MRLWLARLILPKTYKIVKISYGWHRQKKTPVLEIVETQKGETNE